MKMHLHPLVAALFLAGPVLAAESPALKTSPLPIPVVAGPPAANDHEPVPGHGDANAATAPTGPSADGVLKDLKEGNLRFVSDRMINDFRNAARRAELAETQQPFATILSCSDSRVPPEFVFDQGLGKLFVIRVAGNVADTDEIGTIEYGIGHLHTPVLLVMGHTSCGAVKAVVSNAEIGGSIPRLIDNIVPAVLRAKEEATSPEGIVDAAVRANVWVAIEDIFRRSEEVRHLARQGHLRVIGAVYDLHTGMVSWLGSHPGQRNLLAVAAESSPVHVSADAPPNAPDVAATVAPTGKLKASSKH